MSSKLRSIKEEKMKRSPSENLTTKTPPVITIYQLLEIQNEWRKSCCGKCSHRCSTATDGGGVMQECSCQKVLWPRQPAPSRLHQFQQNYLCKDGPVYFIRRLPWGMWNTKSMVSGSQQCGKFDNLQGFNRTNDCVCDLFSEYSRLSVTLQNYEGNDSLHTNLTLLVMIAKKVLVDTCKVSVYSWGLVDKAITSLHYSTHRMKRQAQL